MAINPLTGQPYKYEDLMDLANRGVMQPAMQGLQGLISNFPGGNPYAVPGGPVPPGSPVFPGTLPADMMNLAPAGMALGKGMSQGMQGIQNQLRPMSEQFYGQTLPGILGSFGEGIPAGVAPQSGPNAGDYQRAGNVADNVGDFLSYIFGGQGGPQQGQQAAAQPPAQPPIPGLGTPFPQQGAQQQAPQQGSSGGRQGFRGTPLPRAPQLESSQVNIGSLFDPIMEQLKDPQRVQGTDAIGGLARVLGQAAQGAQQGLLRPETGVAGVLAGAGGGAANASEALQRERQVLEAQYQDAVQRMNVARAGVLSQKAGAEIQLADSIADTKNAQAQLEFNRDVMASQMSQQQVQPLGDGRVMVSSWDPNTGEGARSIIDTVDPLQRTMQQAYLMSQIDKNSSADSRKSAKILIDGKEYNTASLIGIANENLLTPLEKEAFYAALRAVNNPALYAQYGAQIEDYLQGKQADDPVYRAEVMRWQEEPGHMIFDFMYMKMLEDAGERGLIFERAMTGGIGEAQKQTPVPKRERSLGETFGPQQQRYW